MALSIYIRYSVSHSGIPDSENQCSKANDGVPPFRGVHESQSKKRVGSIVRVNRYWDLLDSERLSETILDVGFSMVRHLSLSTPSPTVIQIATPPDLLHQDPATGLLRNSPSACRISSANTEVWIARWGFGGDSARLLTPQPDMHEKNKTKEGLLP